MVIVAIYLYHYFVDVADENAQEPLSIVVVLDVRPLPLQAILKLHPEVDVAGEDELAVGLRVPKILFDPVHLVIELRALIRITVILVKVHDGV